MAGVKRADRSRLDVANDDRFVCAHDGVGVELRLQGLPRGRRSRDDHDAARAAIEAVNDPGASMLLHVPNLWTALRRSRGAVDEVFESKEAKGKQAVDQR